FGEVEPVLDVGDGLRTDRGVHIDGELASTGAWGSRRW
ncbi:MAG: hypothetical protein ACI841_002327, partial [Planctomycetota bacterium]